MSEPKLHEWLRGGSHSSETLPYIADWIVRVGWPEVYGVRFKARAHYADLVMLDAGCGNGQLLLEVSGRYPKTIGWPSLLGCDIEPGHVRIAKRQLQDCWPAKAVICEADFLSGEPLFVDGETQEPKQYHIIAAINWLHNDWKHKHLVDESHRSEEPATAAETCDAFFLACSDCLLPGGVIIADWRGEMRTMRDVRRTEVSPLELIGLASDFVVRERLPLSVPTFVFERAK